MRHPFYLNTAFNPAGIAWVDLGLGGFLASRLDYAAYAADHEGAHKVPTLRNVDLRPVPDFVKAFGHKGYFKSLEEIVHFYNTRDVPCPRGEPLLVLYIALLCIAVLVCSVQKGGTVHIDKDLVAASATPLVLSILAEGESYGYAILKRVRELSGGELDWTDGMLYPLLHRLHRLGYVTTEWRTPPQGRRRKYYAITDEGRSALAEQQRQWTTVTRALNDAWKRFDIHPITTGA